MSASQAEAAAFTHSKSLRSISIDRIGNFLAHDYAILKDVSFNRRIWYPEAKTDKNITLSVWSPPLDPEGAHRRQQGRAIGGDAEYKPAKVGEKFGPSWSTHWFKLEFTVPERFRGEEVHLRWISGSEAMVWSPEGEPLQGLTGDGGRDRREAFLLSKAAVPRAYVFYVEMACNKLFGPEGGITPPPADLEFELEKCEIACFNRRAFLLYHQITVLKDMAKELPENSNVGAKALRAANAIVNVVEPEDESTWAQGEALAQGVLSSTNGSGQMTLYAVGNCHIDTAWLWPYGETRRKTARSWSSQLRLLEEYPDMTFLASQAVQWYWLKQDYPNLFTKVKAAVADGRFLFNGGAWVEMDCNMPSLESFARQFLLGQRFFQAEFGRPCSIFWLPDSFGYAAQIPQICKEVGIDWFMTQKISWNNINKFPRNSFWWQGIDGTKILAHFPPSDNYVGDGKVEEVLKSMTNHKSKSVSNEALYLYGVGDGGGGPQDRMMEMMKCMADMDGLPKVQHATPDAFFAKLAESGPKLSTHVGELYLEFHRGTLTSHGQIKFGNRNAELLLRTIEFLAVLSRVHRGHAYPAAQLEAMWHKVLTNQFHDVLPGTSIKDAMDEALVWYEQVRAAGAELKATALQQLFGGPAGGAEAAEAAEAAAAATADDFVVVNDLGWARAGVVEVPGQDQLSWVEAPPLGFALVKPQQPPEGVYARLGDPAAASAASAASAAADVVLENDLLRVELNAAGRLTRVFDKEFAREVLSPGELGNNLVLHDDQPLFWDAWDVELYHLQKRRDAPAATSFTVLDEAPFRVAVEFRYESLTAASTLTQRVVVEAGSRRVDFETHVSWHESRRCLKVEFPLGVRAEHATYEIAGGFLRRGNHMNTTHDIAKFEVAGHRWSDLSEHGYGAALLNDSKYGHSCHDHYLRLSLLRAPKNPDPSSDMGEHRFTYSLFPHGGTLQDGGVVQAAHGLNSKLHALAAAADGVPAPSYSFMRVDCPGVIIDAVKEAEDAGSTDTVVRMYEAFGGRCKATVTLPEGVSKALRTNMLEVEQEELEIVDGKVVVKFTPFKIVTLRLEH